MSDKEPKLLGNGKLTVAARLAAVWGGALATFGLGALAWVGSVILQEYRSSQAETRQSLAKIETFLAGSVERGNALRSSDAAIQADVKELQVGQQDHDRRLIRLESRR